MNAEHPADYAPLSYGAALTVGLMLILGLPVDETAAHARPPVAPQKNSPPPLPAPNAATVVGVQHPCPACALR